MWSVPGTPFTFQEHGNDLIPAAKNPGVYHDIHLGKLCGYGHGATQAVLVPHQRQITPLAWRIHVRPPLRRRISLPSPSLWIDHRTK